MNDIQKKTEDIINTPINKKAKDLIKERVDEFSALLISLSKLEAKKDGSDEVQRNHVDNAIENIKKNKKTIWGNEFLKVIGGALLGAFPLGFISSIINLNIIMLITHTILGFLGAIFLFLGYRK